MISFKEFIQKYNIRIPLIQRDYVQGLDVNKRKRDAFIENVLSSLRDGKTLSLDFIYGTVDKRDYDANGNHIGVFEPLDGQQRLTTLSLLALMLSKLSSVMPSESVLNSLQQFSYTTRISSTQFCKHLFREKSEFPKGNLSTFIEQRPWYLEEWNYDPTIKAMKEMLDKINNLLNSKEYADKIDIIATNFYGEGHDNNHVVFDELNMGDYNLTDSLYIKMNARGKQLTDFENWKASFIKFLANQYPSSGLKKRFEYSIEHEWTDMLWGHAYDNWNNKTEEEKKDLPYPVIDDSFMNLFNYLFRMLYFSQVDIVDGRDVKADDFDPTSAKIFQNIFCQEKNVEFLFDALDFLARISPKQFFGKLFFVTDSDNDLARHHGIRLFKSQQDTKSVNLFLTNITLGEDMSVKEQLLLYCIIKYGIKYRANDVDDNFYSYVRTCRNLIESIVQRLAKDVTILPNVRLADFKKYDAAIDVLISSPDIKEVLDTLTDPEAISFGNIKGEKDKVSIGVYDDENIAIIENMSFLRGNLSIFRQEVLSKPGYVLKALEDFCTLPQQCKVQLLITFGFIGEDFGPCGYGMRTFFGNTGRWDIIFMRTASTKKETIDSVNAFVEWHVNLPQEDNNILALAEKQIKESIPTEHNFKYYALTYYPDSNGGFLSAKLAWSDSPKFYYAVNGKLDDLDMIAFGSYSSTPLRSYHTEPFASTVYYKLVDKDPSFKDKLSIASINNCKASIYMRSYGCYLGMTGDKWGISYDEGAVELPSNLLDKLNVQNGQLYEQASVDLIATAVNFVETLYRDYPKNEDL